MNGTKKKAAGGYLLGIAVILAIAAAVIYAAFGAMSGNFATAILGCLAGGAVLGILTLVNENFFSDFLSIAMTVVLSIGLALFIRNSTGDFTELITPVGMYGHPDNMPVRFVILGVLFASILFSILEGFTIRVRNAE